MTFNFTNFKFSSDEIEEAAKRIYHEFISTEEFRSSYDCIYISGPVTGVKDYKDRFDEIYNYMKENYSDLGYYFIKPMDYINKMPKKATYIDKVLLTNMILARCVFIILDDRDDKWMNSTGVLCELNYATGNGDISRLSFKQLLEDEEGGILKNA